MAWWKTAKVGDKVVCITRTSNLADGKATSLSVGSVYEIACIEFNPVTELMFGVGVVFRPKGFEHLKVVPHCFKPIDPSKRTTKTGMNILNDIRTRADHYEVV